MTRVVLALAVLFCCIENPAGLRAEEFSWELSGGASRSELDPLLETDGSSVLATYHFGGVEDGTGPYALATFLDPTTSVSAGLSQEKQTSHSISFGPAPIITGQFDLVTETDDYSLSGRYVMRDSRWYFGGSYSENDVEPPQAMTVIAEDSKDYGLVVGKYLGAATSLELELGTSKDRSERSTIVCVGTVGCLTFTPLILQRTTDTAALDVLHVRQFRKLTYSLSGRVSETSAHAEIDTPAISFPLFPGPLPPPPFIIVVPPGLNIPARHEELSLERARVYSVGGEIFPTQKIGVRLGYARFDGPGATADDAYDLAATWFVTRNVGVRFAFARQRAEDESALNDSDTVSLRAMGRF
jgi:hypothetical protein